MNTPNNQGQGAGTGQQRFCERCEDGGTWPHRCKNVSFNDKGEVFFDDKAGSLPVPNNLGAAIGKGGYDLNKNEYTLKKWLWSVSLIVAFLAAAWVGTELHYSQDRNDRTMECLHQTEKVLQLLAQCKL